MVVAAIFEQLIPSERGLARDERVARASAANIDDDDGVWRYQMISDDAPSNHMNRQREGATAPSSKPPTMAPPATRKRRKRCKASKCLASLASDFDVVTDWAFYFHCRSGNGEYRAKYLEDPDAYGRPYLIPPALMSTILVVCVLGTALWLTLATDGRVAAPLLRTLGYDKISMGYLLFFSVIIEDIPQVILTFLVEDYFEEEGTFNNYALVNVVASLYDTLIKLAEAFDERTDVVETGMYCKESLWAHRGNITCIVPIPAPDDDRDDIDMRTRTSLGSSPALNAVAAVAKMSPGGGSKMHVDMPGLITRRKTLLEEAKDIISDTKLPRLRFLSASDDQTVRLWDTNANRIGHIRKKCVRTFRGHSEGVTCMAAVMLSKENRRLVSSLNGGSGGLQHEVGDDEGVIFLTGSSDGSARLWNSRTGICYRSYVTDIPKDFTESIKITSIAHLDTASASSTSTSTSPETVDEGYARELFVCGYKSGKIRMWNMLDGICLAIFDQHVDKVHSICALRASDGFASAGQDGTIKIWRTLFSKQKIDVGYSSPSFGDEIPSLSTSSSSFNTVNGLKAPSLIKKSDQTVVGHVGAVLTVASISPQVVLTGGLDRTARLWNLEMDVCLRVFVGHVDAVTTVAVVDHVTFLTGSRDKTIKVWDGLSASCIRTYTGHTAPVTSITTASPGSFISASEDLTIKLWVFTAVSPPANIDGGGTLNDLLGFDETVPCMTCGTKSDVNEDYNQMTA
ncbi:hypothetical protein ACHAXA_009953 [Cyclostephanos tholiformis]|uniref:Sterol regulatory element-binding protein cleavage-activating protein n=1 Tax=Cyclostephanos tholiformis TaxID=382380 RepID=A0ABD3RY27_9STRA